MTTVIIDRTDLKERIAINDAFTAEERNLLLLAVDNMPLVVEMEMQTPRNYMGRIESLWAYLSVDEGGEGLVAAPMGGRETLPLIAADKTRLDIIRPMALSIARTFGKPVRLACFKQREDVEILQP